MNKWTAHTLESNAHTIIPDPLVWITFFVDVCHYFGLSCMYVQCNLKLNAVHTRLLHDVWTLFVAQLVFLCQHRMCENWEKEEAVNYTHTHQRTDNLLYPTILEPNEHEWKVMRLHCGSNGNVRFTRVSKENGAEKRRTVSRTSVTKLCLYGPQCWSGDTQNTKPIQSTITWNFTLFLRRQHCVALFIQWFMLSHIYREKPIKEERDAGGEN